MEYAISIDGEKLKIATELTIVPAYTDVMVEDWVIVGQQIQRRGRLQFSAWSKARIRKFKIKRALFRVLRFLRLSKKQFDFPYFYSLNRNAVISHTYPNGFRLELNNV